VATGNSTIAVPQRQRGPGKPFVKGQQNGGKPFKKGTSGNPSGRPKGLKDMQEMARARTPQAIEALTLALKNPRERVAAACALLDRGWGKATTVLAVDPDAGPTHISFRPELTNGPNL
jgi:hypothetical protein